MVNYRIALPNHVVFDLYGVDPGVANDLEAIRGLSRKVVERLRSDMVGEVYKVLEPQGIIYVALLLQSHVSIHTWPEIGYVAMDVYTCGEVPVTEIVDDVVAFFRPKRYRVSFISRPVLQSEAERQGILEGAQAAV